MNKIKKILVLLALLIITILQIIPTPVEARTGGGSLSIIIMKEKITKYRYDTRNDFKDKKLNYKSLVNGRKSIFCITKSLDKK